MNASDIKPNYRLLAFVRVLLIIVLYMPNINIDLAGF